MARLAEAGESARGSCWWLPDSWFLLPADGQHARRSGGGCPKSCSREVNYLKYWAACAAEKWRLPKTCAYYLKYWAACAAEKGRLPKTWPAGCLLLEVLGSMCGVKGAAAQNLVRGILIE